MNARIVCALVLCALLAAQGCSTCKDSYARNYDFRGLRSIAVAEIRGDLRSEAARDQVGHFFTVELLDRGYDVVERRNVKAILAEQDFQLSDLTARRGMARAGRLLNVEAILTATIAASEERMVITAEAMEVDSGRVLWAATSSGTTAKTLLTTVGAGVGGIIGWVFGGDREGRLAGAAAGGTAGGLIARELTPDQQRLAQRLVAGMCRTFPERPPFD